MPSRAEGVHFWLPNLGRKFEETVNRLHKVTETPSPEQSFDLPTESGPPTRVLRLKDELQLASHVAVLAQAIDDVRAISAVGIEETKDELLFTLASNEKPNELVVKALRSVLRHISESSQTDENKAVLVGDLLQRVVELSQKRILWRLSPSWVDAPIQSSKRQQPLQDFITEKLLPKLCQLGGGNDSFKTLTKHLKHVVVCLGQLERQGPATTPIKRLRLLSDIIRHCSQVSRLIPPPTKEDGAQGWEDVAQTRGLDNIQKTGRYLDICEDFATFRQQKKYRNLSRSLQLQVCDIEKKPNHKGAYPVHAEVQLVIFYDRQRVKSPNDRFQPRVLGCSRSACHLCFRFVREHGVYHLQSTHGRLYPKWTIPSPSWLSGEQLRCYRRIVESMIRGLEESIVQAKPRRSLAYPKESKLFLPAMTESLLSTSSPVIAGLTPITEIPPLVSQTTNHVEGSMHQDLVPLQPVLPTAELLPSHLKGVFTSPFCIQMDGLSLQAELCGTVPVRVSVVKMASLSSQDEDTQVISATTLPTTGGLELARGPRNSKLSFLLKYDEDSYLKVELSSGNTASVS